MRAQSQVSTWLSHPRFRGAWVTLAAGSFAGLAILGACSDGTVSSKVAGPNLRFQVDDDAVGALHHRIVVCVDPLSSPGSYSFASVFFPDSSGFFDKEDDSIDPDLSGFGITQNKLGPYVPGDIITTPKSMTPGQCADVFVRMTTINNDENRLWTGAFGLVNPSAALNITATIPAGYTYTASCVNDDIFLPQTDGCDVAPIVANPIVSSANVFHGSSVIWKFTAPADTPCPAGSFSWSVDGSGNLQVVYDQFPAPNDNSYGAGSVGWKPNRPHRIKDLYNSDHAGIQLKNPSNQVVLSFMVDYLSASTGTPSGYKSLGVTGGDGGMLTGTAQGISATTSLAKNLNETGFCVNGNCSGLGTDLLVDSPPTINDQSYTLVPGSPYGAWNFHDTYFVTISASKLAGMGFNKNTWKVEPNSAVLHNSPPKECPE